MTGLAIASRPGFDVVGIETDRRKVKAYNSGKVPFFEPGLEVLLKKACRARRFRASSDYEDCADSDVSIIAVGTPSSSNGSPDLTYVKNAASELSKVVHRSHKRMTVVVKSTVIPGTARNVVGPLLGNEAELGSSLGLASNPEFLAEGTAVDDMLHPSRLVVGAADRLSASAMRSLYSKFYGEAFKRIPYIETTLENAELIKYASNSLLSLKVSFINEIARICEATPNADVDTVALGVGLDRRLGRSFLKAGPGWGGSCFRKDVSALLAYSEELLGARPKVLAANLASNVDQRSYVVRLAEKALGGLKGKEIAVLGVAFKARTDDVRDSQAFDVVSKLLVAGSKVSVYDPSPAALENFKAQFKGEEMEGGDPTYSTSLEDCLRGREGAVILTDWDEFKKLKPSFFSSLMNGEKALVDTRRIYDRDEFRRKSLRYVALGVNDE